MTEFFASVTFADLIGVVGTILVAAAYFATQARWMNSDDLAFPVVNLIGSLMIAWSLVFSFNLASALMEGFWILISVMGIWQALRRQG